MPIYTCTVADSAGDQIVAGDIRSPWPFEGHSVHGAFQIGDGCRHGTALSIDRATSSP